MNEAAEEAAHAHARAVVAGDLGTAIRGMTPEGLAKSMQVGNTSWTYFGYELTGQEQDGDDCVFEITYATDIGALKLRDRFRRIDGEWKLVDVERVP